MEGKSSPFIEGLLEDYHAGGDSDHRLFRAAQIAKIYLSISNQGDPVLQIDGLSDQLCYVPTNDCLPLVPVIIEDPELSGGTGSLVCFGDGVVCSVTGSDVWNHAILLRKIASLEKRLIWDHEWAPVRSQLNSYVFLQISWE